MFESDLEGLVEPFSDNARFVRWAEALKTVCQSKTVDSAHAELWGQWQELLQTFPPAGSGTLDATGDTVVIEDRHSNISSDLAGGQDHRANLLKLCPWRIGPYRFFGIDLQTEWDSCLKWKRLAPAVWFDGAKVLDVGCNNGYFGWRALAAGAKCVVGCDPFLLYNVQHQLLRRYSSDKHRHHILPIGDDEIPSDLRVFDVAMSLGVLIHKRSPIDHLMQLHGSLRKRGQLVLETMAIDSMDADLLVPEDRYMKMRGIWFVPTIGMLQRWLVRTGFAEIKIIDVSVTDASEQRRTEFMPFESLDDFLDPSDNQKTIEGVLAPVRVVITAVQKP